MIVFFKGNIGNENIAIVVKGNIGNQNINIVSKDHKGLPVDVMLIIIILNISDVPNLPYKALSSYKNRQTMREKGIAWIEENTHVLRENLTDWVQSW